MKSTIFILSLQLLYCFKASAQLDSSDSKDEIIKSFFQSKATIDFMQPEKDSIINMIDVDSTLAKIGINKWGSKRLNIVSTGDTVLKIRKEGIFYNFSGKDSYFIFAENIIDNVTYYRIFRPRTGADSHFGIIKKGKKYFTVKKGSGWF